MYFQRIQCSKYLIFPGRTKSLQLTNILQLHELQPLLKDKTKRKILENIIVMGKQQV